MEAIGFRLNGKEVCARGVDAQTTLLQYLRESGLTGTKEGCAEGECGACAVALIERASDGTRRFMAVNSCLLLLPMLQDRELYTVEGLAQGEQLHPVQAALAEAGGSQCGYCTPGFVMSLFAEYYRPGRSEFDPEALSGNLCRCTGYRPIRAAAQALSAPAPDDPFLQQLHAPPAPRTESGPHVFSRFYRPISLQQLFALLEAEPEARTVAGATDLAVESNLRGRRWPVLVSLEGIAELRQMRWGPDMVEIGSTMTLSAIEQQVAGRLPLLEQLLPLFASRLIRNRATLGGNLATASPIGDAAPVLLALGAEICLLSARGERLLPLAAFFTGYRQTALQPGEIIRAVRIPLPLWRRARLYKVAKRARDDISTVAAAFAIECDAGERIAAARLAYGGVAPTPVRAAAAEAALIGRRWDAEAVRAAQAALAGAFAPISDQRGSAAYRQRMILNLLAKFYAETMGVRL